MDSFIESFELQPFLDLEMMYYEDTIPEMETYLSEMALGINNRNIFQRFAEVGRKLIKLILKGISKLISFISNIIGGNKSSVNDIAESIGLSASDPYSITSSKSDGNKEPISIKSTSSGFDEVIVSVKSEVDDSTIDYTVLATSISVKIDRNDDSIRVNWDDYDTSVIRRSVGSVPGKSRAADFTIRRGLKYIYEATNNLDFIPELAFDIGLIANESNDERRMKAVLKDIESIDPEAKPNPNFFLLHISNIKKMSRRVESLYNAYEKLPVIDDYNNKSAIEAVNKINEILYFMQYGINFLTQKISGIYDIDAKYIGSIKSIDKLDEFVFGMISKRVPHKFIARNAVIALSPDLRGSTDVDHPIYGQTRLAIFPPKNINGKEVYKVALNYPGIADNKRDMEIYNKLKEHGDDRYIATPFELSKNGCVETAERVDTKGISDDVGRRIASEMKKKLATQDFVNRYGFYINDIHSKNVGRTSDGKYVVLDYADLTYDSKE